jgi:peptide/nickel transport system substrate-binding protein
MLRLCAVVLSLLVAVGCSRIDPRATPGERHPYTKAGVLRIADVSEPDHFNPLLSTMDLVEGLSSLVFSYLVIADDNGKLIGDLATEVPTLANGGISKDGRTVTYHLRKDVVWHDGVRFTSRDVKWTWTAVLNGRNNVFHREGYTEVAAIDAPDDTTLVVHLKRRYPPFVTQFFTTLQEGSKPILPEHLLGKLPNINEAPFNAAPIGTGPFKFVRWDRGRGITLVANENYFHGRPKLDRIEFVVIPDDNTILAQVKSHDVDFVVSPPGALVEQFRGLDGVTTDLASWSGQSIFLMNNAHPGLRDPAVRRAISRAIDFDSIITKVTHGVGERAYDIIPPIAIGYVKNPPYTYDPAAARAILEKNGWKAGADGIRAKGTEKLDFVMSGIAGSANSRALAVQIQGWLHDVGINMTIKNYPYNVVFAYDGPIISGKYDFAYYSETLNYDPDNLTYLGCDRFPPKGENSFRYCDPIVDAGERAGLTVDNPQKRAKIYEPIERRIHDTIPYLPMYELRRLSVRNSDMKGYRPSPTIAPWWNAWEWSI